MCFWGLLPTVSLHLVRGHCKVQQTIYKYTVCDGDTLKSLRNYFHKRFIIISKNNNHIFDSYFLHWTVNPLKLYKFSGHTL